MKEPKFKLGQEVWFTLYSRKDKKIVPKKETICTISISAPGKFEYALYNGRSFWRSEEALFSTEEEARKYAAVENIADRMDHARWDINNLNTDIRYLEEILATRPETLKKKRAALKRAETKLAKLKKQLEDMKA